MSNLATLIFLGNGSMKHGYLLKKIFGYAMANGLLIFEVSYII